MKRAFLMMMVLLAACSRQEPEIAPGAYRIYVSNEMSGDLSVIDSRTHMVEATIKLGKRPRGVVASADGKWIFVALTGSPIAAPGVDESTLPPADKAADGVGVVNASTLTLEKTLRGVSDPEQLGIAPDGNTLFLASQDLGRLLAMDIAGGTVLKDADAGEEPEGIALSPDGKLLYVSSEEKAQVTAFDTATFTRQAVLAVGERPRGLSFSPDGQRVYVSGENDASLTVIDTQRQVVLQKITVPGVGAKPMGVAVSPDGKQVFVATGRGGTLVRFDAATGKVTGSVAVGTRPWGVAVSADGRLVYTANGQSNDVTVVDAQSMSLILKVKAGDRPWGVAVARRIDH